MKKILLILTASALFFGACAQSEPESAVTEKEVENMEKIEIINDTPEVFENSMEGDFLLLDVRTPEEYHDGHIEGSLLIPVSELEDRLDEIAEYQNKRVLVYCRSGNRSVTASNILLDNGYTEVHNLLTGFNGWSAYKNK